MWLIKGILLSFLSIQAIFGIEYLILDKEYSYKNKEVYAKDLFPNLENNFFLLSIPNASNQYQVKSSQIIQQFENEGIIIGAKEPIITFKREFLADNTSIKNHILGEFLREYQKNHIQIKGIFLEQITPINFKESQIVAIDFHSRLLKRNAGSFDIVITENYGQNNAQSRKRKVYFKYRIEATLKAIKTTKTIRGRTSVDYNNARIVEIPFEKISSPLMQESEMGSVAVRSYTPKDIIITEERLIPKRIVQKGDKITVLLQEEGVLLEFILIAQKDAAKGDIINGREVDGKKNYKIKIIEKGKGELQ